jgi:uncharacterized protein YdcH (DUF465 family)
MRTMAMGSPTLKEMLARENNEFKQLYETHQSYEQRLDQLVKRPYLTTAEEMEISELKKKKLILKDQMLVIMEKYRDRQAS